MKKCNELPSGITYQKELGVLPAGSYQMRVAVRDAVSESTASASSYVEIPDFNKPTLDSSSVLLFDSQATDTLQSSAFREFHPGDLLRYNCVIYGAKHEINSGRTAVNLNVRLFKDGNLINTTSLGDISAQPEKSESAIPAAGTFRLPSALATGDYAIEFVASDQLGDAKHPVSRWSDFTVTPGDK